ncbi:hypothetical protein CDAR_466241 [Caerostris darwini]|uniref:Uncharacterized protein n=1 Tax=Caerostris darwini TaxID=1538125 RepID=A0AAV4WPX7_9ARAC|nr:hypothetical protein CDAR_466241 [Caerostris darwini]
MEKLLRRKERLEKQCAMNRVYVPLSHSTEVGSLQLPMPKEVKTKSLVSRKDSAVTNNLPSNWTGDEGEGEPLGTRVFYPHLLDEKRMGGEAQDEDLKWKKKKLPSGVVDNGG